MLATTKEKDAMELLCPVYMSPRSGLAPLDLQFTPII
jgi:hypothetical protein